MSFFLCTYSKFIFFGRVFFSSFAHSSLELFKLFYGWVVKVPLYILDTKVSDIQSEIQSVIFSPFCRFFNLSFLTMSLMGKSSLFWSSPNFLILFLISFVLLLYINFHWQMQSHEDLLYVFSKNFRNSKAIWMAAVKYCGCLFLKLCRKVFSLSPEYVVSLFIFINIPFTILKKLSLFLLFCLFLITKSVGFFQMLFSISV